MSLSWCIHCKTWFVDPESKCHGCGEESTRSASAEYAIARLLNKLGVDTDFEHVLVHRSVDKEGRVTERKIE